MPDDTETSFQRAMRIAEENKAKQWREYRQMRQEQRADGRVHKEMFEDGDIELAPVLVPVLGVKAANLYGDKRSTRHIRVYYHVYATKRPTENKAFKYARGENGLDMIVVLRQEPAHELRYCHGCQVHHSLQDFDYIKKRYPPPSGHTRQPGYRWYCRMWLRKKRNGRAA